MCRDSGRFVFGLDRSVKLDPERGRLVIILLALLTLILAGAFLPMRWILRPVRWLHEGVREIGRGNLKHRVPLKRSNELRDLAAAFNDMTDRIQDMLHTKEQLMLDVSHELRSPLTRMNVVLEFLPEGQAKDSLKSDIAEMETMINVDKSPSKRTGGYGLGLSLCKTIMEAHSGRIEVDSKPDVGTCVSLFFPQ